MPLKNKYLKYTPEISSEIFKEIWTKLINSGWKATCDFVSISDRFYEFKKGEHLYNNNPSRKSFYINYKNIQKYIKDSNHILIETTVQEILGYDPFVKEVIEEVIPEYVECIEDIYGLEIGKIYHVDNNIIKDGRYNSYSIINNNKIKPSTKEAFDAQNKPKQPLKQAVHCKTQEEWDFVTEKLDRKWKNAKWSDYKENSKIKLNYHEYGRNYEDYYSFQEWCDLNGYKMEKEVKFEVGKWYKLNNCWWAKFHGLKGNSFYMSELINADFKYEKRNPENPANTDLDLNNIIVLADIEEIQQYLPEGHSDKITPVIQQARDIQKSNQGFKPGDYVAITMSSKNWAHSMNKEVGKIVKITSISDNGYINYIGKPFWSFGARDGHFRHATPEEINSHLISIGQIPAGEPIDTGIEPDKDGIFKYTTCSGTTHTRKTATVPGPLKMTLSINDEELPMVNIIKTKTVNLLSLE